MAKTAPKSVQGILTAGAASAASEEEDRLKRFREALNAAVPEPAKPSPVMTTLTGAPKDAITPMTAPAPMPVLQPAPAAAPIPAARATPRSPEPAPAPTPAPAPMVPPAEPPPPVVTDRVPKIPGPRVPEPETPVPATPPPPTRGEVPTPAPAVPAPVPAPVPEPEPIVKPTKKTGDEPAPEEPAAPAPPDRTPTATPREPVTTPSPPVAPTGDRTATPRDETPPGDRTAVPRQRPARWNVRNLLTAMRRPGGYGQAFAGGEALPELETFMQQQEAARAGRSSRLQSLLGARQNQPRVGSSAQRPR